MIDKKPDQFLESFELRENKKHVNGEISIAWRNLCYGVGEFSKWNVKKKPILRELNGHLRAGSLTGLLGPSGAGKTTLLECLSGNKKSGISENSQIFISSDSKSANSYFISQHVHENIIRELTVGQILRYAFAFKNGTANGNKMQQHITATMAALMLPPDLVSRPFASCSGGEQKRVAIAQELMSLTAPSFLFLDEPTSGLDSAAAFKVMLCLQKLAKEQIITIIASIHAPNDETLNLFDNLYILSKSGLCIYSGSPKNVRMYLETQLQLTIPLDQPPIEALIKIASTHIDEPHSIALASFTQAVEFPSLSTATSQLKSAPLGLPNTRKPFSLPSLITLTSRNLCSTCIANYRLFFAQILIHILNILFLSSLFHNDMVLPSGCYSLNTDSNTSCQTELEQNAKLNENINFHVFCGAIEGFVIACSNTLLFASIVKVFHNEYRNRWYSLGVFYWSVNIVSILELTIYVISISTTSYLATAQYAIDNNSLKWNRFAQFTLSFWLLGLYTQSLGQLIGVLVMHSAVIAVVTSIMIYMIMDIMNDFLFKTDEFDNDILVMGSNVVGLKYVTKYMIYVFYGIDRCKENEFSVVLQKHYVKEEEIWFYIRRIGENILVMRVATLITLYLKFNSFNLVSKCFRKNQQYNDSYELIPINFNQTESVEMVKHQNCLAYKPNNTKSDIIAWRNLSLFSSKSLFKMGLKSKQRKAILRNLNGQFKFGTLNAVMGPSGAGKTTLLKVLNGRLMAKLSDESRFYLADTISTCFITQEVSGHLMPGLSTKQMLVYASRLKNVGKDVDHEQIALKWLGELDLMNTVDTKVEKCSGGERKRLALALELTSVEMPALICIDEPTSGLDTNSAEIVISTLYKLTLTHSLTIITSIHQPTVDILYMFDQLYVLARWGVCIYSGQPNQIQTHLNQISQNQFTTSNFPIEELIKLSCNDYNDELIEQLVEKTNKQLVNCQLHENVQEMTKLQFQTITTFSSCSSYILALRYFTLFRAHLWKEYLLFYIILLSYAFSLHIFWSSAIAQTSGCLNIESDYLNNSCNRSEERLKQDKDIDNSLKFIFFMNNIFLLLILLQSSLTLFKEITYFYNEHQNGWYSTGSFYLMKSAIEILPLFPMIFLYIYICDIYSVIIPGFYWQFLLIIVLSIFASQGMAHLIVLLANGQIAVLTLVFMIVYDCFLLLSNFFVNVHRLNLVYRIVSHFSISRFGFEALLLNVYAFGRCDVNIEVQPVLEWLLLKEDDYWFCIAMLAINCAVFRVISFGLLFFKTNNSFTLWRK